MSLDKNAQFLDPDGFKINELDLDQMAADDVADLQVSLDLLPENEEEETLLSEEEGELTGKIEIELGDETLEQEFSFSLPLVPGADDQTEIEEPSEIEVEDSEIEIESDPWQWKGLDKFLPWLQEKIKSVPKHTGHDTVGLMRAIEYLKECDKHCSRAARQDYNGIIDIDLLERAREEILQGIDRLEERLEVVETKKFKKNKKKKKADEDFDGLVKEGHQALRFEVQVPVFISHLARIIINGHVSAGHSMEKTFEDLDKKFKLDDRERASVVQVIQDMGYPIFGDRFYGAGEKYDPTSSDNYDFMANYQA